MSNEPLSFAPKFSPVISLILLFLVLIAHILLFKHMVKINDIFCFDFDFSMRSAKIVAILLRLWKYGKHQINKSNQNKQTNKQVNTFLKQHSSIIISLHQNQDKSIKHVVKMENGMGSPLAAKKLNVGKYPGWPMEKSMF